MEALCLGNSQQRAAETSRPTQVGAQASSKDGDGTRRMDHVPVARPEKVGGVASAPFDGDSSDAANDTNA